MHSDPEQIVDVYSISFFDPIRKKRFTSKNKMTEEEAAKQFAGTKYNILYGTKEQRRIGGNWVRNFTSNFGGRYDMLPKEGPEVPRYYIWYLDDVKGWQQSPWRLTIRAAAVKYAGVEWDPIWPSECFFREEDCYYL